MTAYLSDQVISGFTTGAGFHVLTAQVPKVLNIKSPRHNGFGTLFKVGLILFLINFGFFQIYRDIIAEISHTNLTAVLVTFVTFVILFIGKELINPSFKKRFKVPIPFELVVVSFGD